MKKFLLSLLALFAIAGTTMAQDVYYAGSYTGASGQKFAAVYKNGQMLHNSAVGSTDCNSTAVVVDEETGDYYWVRNSQSYGDVMKNASMFLNNSATGTHINDLCLSSDHLYSGGYLTSGSVRKAVVWRNNIDTPHYVVGDGTHDSEVLGVCITPTGGVYSCGYQNTSTSQYNGIVWYGTTVSYTVPDVKIQAVAYYAGSVYYVGRNNYGKAVVYSNSTLLYTLSDSDSSMGFDIVVDGNDIYVTGFRGSTHVCVWKNGDVLYDHENGIDGYLRGVAVNSEGVYYVGCNSSNQGIVYKDGEILYAASNCQDLSSVYVTKPECEDETPRALPFVEDFEIGETDWACWTVVDEGDNGNTNSYWERYGIRSLDPASGHYCARHNYNSTQNQEGWLISPKLYLQPGRDGTELSFQTREGAPSDLRYEGVWISTTTANPSAFTEVWSETTGSTEWKTVYIDLDDYQGQAVYIAFKYTGTNGHVWYIDDIHVTEHWGSCGILACPYVQEFETNEPGYCWYVLDADMSGGLRNWKKNDSDNSVYHPWGQPNMPQDGWLFSPIIDLPAGSYYQLTYNEKVSSFGTNMKNSILISVDKSGVPNPNDYTEIASQTSDFPANWTTRSIDLSAYAGHKVSIAFRYQGTYAHNWYIDDFSIDVNIPEYNITVESNNTSWGTVTGGGIYPHGTNVTINAEAKPGYEFKQWNKDGSLVSNEAAYSFVATENATYTAIFGEPAVTYYNITTEVTPEGAGSVQGAGPYASGETAVLIATANSGWRFAKWQDNNTDNPREVAVTGNATYTAHFEMINYNLIVTASPAAGGTVTGSGSYHYGQLVEISATANEGYTFLNWNDGVTAATRTITISKDEEYIAYFAASGTNVYTINAVPNDPALGEVIGGGVFAEGTTITLTATPIGYATFTKWDDGNTDNPRTVVVNADATYVAEFVMAEMFTITVESLNPEMGSVSGGGQFPAGAEITIQANAFGGYYFDGWSDNVYDNPRTVVVTGNATYRAKFSAQQAQTFMLTVSCDPSKGAVTGNGTYPAGTTVTIEAIAYDGYEFFQWNDSNKDNPRTVTINSNMTLVAYFYGVGVDENSMPVLAIYPNPANETIFIEGLQANSEVRIYNSLGMLVKTVNTDKEVNISDLAAGLYVVRCKDMTVRFIKN